MKKPIAYIMIVAVLSTLLSACSVSINVARPRIYEGTANSTFASVTGAVPLATVDYKLKDGLGTVSVNELPDSYGIGLTAGRIGSPINITVQNDSVVDATIAFNYDASKLGKAKAENLKVAWYDEALGRMVLLEDSDVDTTNSKVSVHTTHFSEY